MAKKMNTPKKPKNNGNDDTGKGFHALANAIEGLGELPASYRMEEIADNLASLASELGTLAHVSAMSVIAQHGTEDDRTAALKYLKRHFERGTFEDE